MHRQLLLAGAMLGSLILAGCAIWDSDEEIAVSQVPTAVMDAAKRAVEGLQIKEAEVEQEGGQTVYELEGKADGVEYEIEVSAAGELLEVKKDD